MRVAVITPYFQEDTATLERCHASVAQQSHPCEHFMVADGFPNPVVDGWNAQHITLPVVHGVGGETPRAIGSIAAIRQGFDAITFLDADNWFYPDHIATMVMIARASGRDICVPARSQHRPDGSRLDIAEFFARTRYLDTNCIFLTRRAFGIALVWGLIPAECGAVCDHFVSLAILRRKHSIARCERHTVAYQTMWTRDYLKAGEVPPANAKSAANARKALRVWENLPEARKKFILGEFLPESPIPARRPAAGRRS